MVVQPRNQRPSVRVDHVDRVDPSIARLRTGSSAAAAIEFTDRHDHPVEPVDVDHRAVDLGAEHPDRSSHGATPSSARTLRVSRPRRGARPIARLGQRPCRRRAGDDELVARMQRCPGGDPRRARCRATTVRRPRRSAAIAAAATSPVNGSAMASATKCGTSPIHPTRPPAAAVSSPKPTRTLFGGILPCAVTDAQTRGPVRTNPAASMPHCSRTRGREPSMITSHSASSPLSWRSPRGVPRSDAIDSQRSWSSAKNSAVSTRSVRTATCSRC